MKSIRGDCSDFTYAKGRARRSQSPTKNTARTPEPSCWAKTIVCCPWSKKPRIRGTGYDNAGIYVLTRAVESLFPGTIPWSLERDLLPKLAGCYGFVTASPLYDIGTPERLARFREIWQETSAGLPIRSFPHAQGSIS